ncbi:MAG: DoxX family protein [Myxococcota bacterium]
MSSESTSSRGRTIGYWVTTVLFCLPMVGGAIFDTLRPPEVVEGFQHLGYPLYFAPMLGVAKGLGVIAVLAPKFPRLKEWAYAGFTFDLIAASASHAALSDPIPDIIVPIVILGLMFASYFLRPDSRKLESKSA